MVMVGLTALFYICAIFLVSTLQAATIIRNSEEYEAVDKGLARALPINSSYDAFISYRRAPSHSMAMLLKVMLKAKNIEAFLDVDDLQGGLYQQQPITRIDQAPNFIIVITTGTLDRCLGDTNYTDILHQEMKEAVDKGKRIIPIFDEFTFPSLNYSDVINKVMSFQGVAWQHALAAGSLDKVIQYMDTTKPAAV